MKRCYFLTFVLFSFLVPIYAFEWPLDNFTFSMLFGDAYSKQGNFQSGIVLKGTDEVKAAEYGKKLIVIEESKTLNSFPSTLGNAIVISHDKGLQTIYAGLKDIPAINDSNSNVETFSIIGSLGKSAWGNGEELTFQVIDTQEKSFINPATPNLLPLIPFEDKISPIITGTVLFDEKTKQSYNIETIKSIKQGEYDLYTFTKDRIIDSSESFMPFNVSIAVNGKIALDVQFYVLESSKGELYLKKTRISSEKLYNSEGKIYLGKLSLKRGSTEIVISATDISQNTTRVPYSLQVD